MESCDEFYIYDKASQKMIGVVDGLLVPVTTAAGTKFVLSPATGCPSGAAALSTTASYTLKTAGSVPSSVYLDSATAIAPCTAKLKVLATPAQQADVPIAIQLDRIPTEQTPDVSLKFTVAGTAYSLGICNSQEYGGTTQAGSTFIFRSTPTAPGDTQSSIPKLSTGALVGIIIGSVFLFLLILTIFFLFLNKKRREKNVAATHQATTAPAAKK